MHAVVTVRVRACGDDCVCACVHAVMHSSTYQTPFAALGQSPEGVSSLLFPQLMGISKANEVRSARLCTRVPRACALVVP